MPEADPLLAETIQILGEAKQKFFVYTAYLLSASWRIAKPQPKYE